jgi:NADPH:quinone reductase-like Zn-dependent oxidoreductase
MAGGIGFAATNLPLILRGVSLVGISSSNTPYAMREILWERLGNVWRPRHMDAIITNEVKLDDLGDAFDVMMKGGSLGRTVVDLS